MPARFVFDDCHVPELQAPRLIGPQARVGGEQHVIVKLFAFPFVARQLRLVRALSGGLVKLPVFLRREPRAVRDFRRLSVWLGEIGKAVEPSLADCGFQRLAQGHDFLVHGVIGGRLAALGDGFFMAVNPVVLNLAGGDFREAHMAEERDQVDGRAPVLALDVILAALALGDDVVFAEILLGGFAEGLLGFDFSAAEFSAKLEIPILGDFLGFGETVFFGAAAAILAREICGALPLTAIRPFDRRELCRRESCIVPPWSDILPARSEDRNV